MTDPLGLIGNSLVQRPTPQGGGGASGAAGGPSFKDAMDEALEQVNSLERDAKNAAEDLMAGRRDDVETVMIAARKADTAFRMLLQVRNKVMDAYEEVKQMRI
ncbi:MAG: flagellar hook-basal body complex protein FliE [Planctomycetota bacterium]|jgi:flagellar hook-basal body complex protein FliE